MKAINPDQLIKLLSTTLIALALFGCDERKMMRPNKTVSFIGTHRVTIEPGSPHVRSTASGIGESRVYDYTCAETKIILRQDDLLVNRKSYGALRPSDEILVSYGSVYINGEKAKGRIPVEKRDPTLEEHEVPESESRLGGYTIRVRPGHKIKSRFHLQGAYVWRLGDRRFAIKDNEFFIDDVNFGKLTKGDSIMVEKGRVFISGRERLSYNSREANKPDAAIPPAGPAQ